MEENKQMKKKKRKGQNLVVYGAFSCQLSFMRQTHKSKKKNANLRKILVK